MIRRHGKGLEMLSSGHGQTNAAMTSEQQWLPAVSKLKTGPISCKIYGVLPSPAKLLTSDGS